MKYLKLIPIIFLIGSMAGCANKSVLVTFYGDSTNGYNSFKYDLKRCESKSVFQIPDDLEHNQIGSDSYDYKTSLMLNSCLTEIGWKPVIQFISDAEVHSSDLIEGIRSCVLTNRSLQLPSIGETYVNSKSQHRSDSEILSICLSKQKGKTISAPPWLNTDLAGEISIPLVNYPANLAYDADAIQEDINGIVFRDRNLALSWSIPEDNFLSWESAVSKLRDINTKRYAGKDDWRIPSKEELEVFLATRRQETLKQNTVVNGNLSRLDGLFWTASYPVEGNNGRFVLDFNSGALTVLDISGPYVCKLLIVRGKGWQVSRQ